MQYIIEVGRAVLEFDFFFELSDVFLTRRTIFRLPCIAFDFKDYSTGLAGLCPVFDSSMRVLGTTVPCMFFFDYIGLRDFAAAGHVVCYHPVTASIAVFFHQSAHAWARVSCHQSAHAWARDSVRWIHLLLSRK